MTTFDCCQAFSVFGLIAPHLIRFSYLSLTSSDTRLNSGKEYGVMSADQACPGVEANHAGDEKWRCGSAEPADRNAEKGARKEKVQAAGGGQPGEHTLSGVSAIGAGREDNGECQHGTRAERVRGS